MRIAVYGAGALGTILGAYLTRNAPEHEIHLFNRNLRHVQALNEGGARITGQIGFTQKVKAFLPEEMEGEYDYIFLLTKQLENAKTIEFLKPHLRSDGALCTMQNGLPEPPIAQVLGRERTLGCTIGWGATLGEPGESRLTSSPDALVFTLGSPYPEAKWHLPKVRCILENMGTVYTEENFLGARWSKLLINATFSGMGTVIGGTFGDVCDNRMARRLAQKVIKECIEVTKAAGIRIAPVMGNDIARLFYYSNPLKRFVSYSLIPFAMRRHRGIIPGMLVDIRKGKPCEVDAIVGSACREGDRVNVETPVCDMMYSMIRSFEMGNGVPSTDNLAQFSALS
ncbi:MAG: 2-dehydropantoate 2-reductase [Spirochaetales bacterium]|nr:2-dehydropantoate 2-reductase [Spirochaetales bacterium]